MQQRVNESEKDYTQRSFLAFIFKKYVESGYSKIEAKALCDQHAAKFDSE